MLTKDLLQDLDTFLHISILMFILIAQILFKLN